MERLRNVSTWVLAISSPFLGAFIAYKFFGLNGGAVGFAIGFAFFILIPTVEWFRVMCFCFLFIVPFSYLPLLFVNTGVSNYYAELRDADISEQVFAHAGWSFVLGMIVTFAVTYGAAFSSGMLRGKKIMGKAMLEEIEKSQKDPMIKGE